jgi:hypothetical protein
VASGSDRIRPETREEDEDTANITAKPASMQAASAAPTLWLLSSDRLSHAIAYLPHGPLSAADGNRELPNPRMRNVAKAILPLDRERPSG